MLKVMLVSYQYEAVSGGADYAVEMLVNFLLNQNCHVTILTSHAKKGVAIEDQGELRIIRFYPPNLYWVKHKDHQPLLKKIFWQLIDIWNPLVYSQVKQIIDADSPDLVHVHKLRGLSPAVWTAAKDLGLPVIHSCHDFELISPQGTLSGVIGRLYNSAPVLFTPYQIFRRAASQGVDVVSAPTAFVMNLHQKHGFFKGIKNTIIPNTHGLTTEQVLQNSQFHSTSNHTKPSDSLHLLYLGRLASEKGIAKFCELFINIQAQFPQLRLTIAGTGPLEGIMRNRYKGNKSIQFTGFVSGQAKIGLIDNCNYVIVPSLCQEVFPIVIAEALAHGKPILANRVGGIPEIIQHGVTGFLANPGNAQSWADTIQLASKSIYDLLSKNCYKKSLEYTIEKTGTRFLEIYKEIGTHAQGWPKWKPIENS